MYSTVSVVMTSHKHGHPAGGSPSDPEFAVCSYRAAPDHGHVQFQSHLPGDHAPPPGDPPVPAVEAAPGRESEPKVALGVGRVAGPLQVEDDRPGHAPHGQVAGDPEARTGRLHAGRGESEQRVAVRVQEVAAAQMPVALVVVGPDAPGPDREPDDGPRRVVTVQTRAALELLEPAAHLHDEQGPADEAE